MRRFLCVVALLAACHQPPPDGPAPAAELVGLEWQLVELYGQMAPSGANRQQPTLIFSADSGVASGYAGCNTFRGAYTLSRDSLSFGPLVLTRMYCEGTQALEDAYLKALAATTRQRLIEGHLELLAGSTMVARFSR